MGFAVELPYFWGPDDDTDVLFTPRLMSRQGALFAVEVTHRFTRGVADVKASGVYQLDPGAFANTVGDRQWRGAIQTSGRFTPYADWVAGWSYTKFTDAAYLPDYRLTTGKNLDQRGLRHPPDARHFPRPARAGVQPARQRHRRCSRTQHAKAIPNFRGEHIDRPARRLGPGSAQRLACSASIAARDHVRDGQRRALHLRLPRDEVSTAPPRPRGRSSSSRPAAFAVTPFAGVRVDAAHYDGGSALLPGEVSLLTATPIAALDVRWPLIAFNGGNSHLFEPIAQIVYRGSDDDAAGHHQRQCAELRAR